jgi:hypothetical protein
MKFAENTSLVDEEEAIDLLESFGMLSLRIIIAWKSTHVECV